MERTTILIVDDERRFVRFVKTNLEAAGYRALAAGDGGTALATVEAQRPDLVILDTLMPGTNGYEVCERIRQFSSIPIIMLAAHDEGTGKIRCFELGADDCLIKPFGGEELLARVNAVLRRVRLRDAPRFRPPFVCDEFEIDFACRTVLVRGQQISLSPTEYKLLCQLAYNDSRVMSHEELLTKVWGPDHRDEVEYLRVYVHYLRQKIEADPGRPKYILSRPGVGYVLSGTTAVSE